MALTVRQIKRLELMSSWQVVWDSSNGPFRRPGKLKLSKQEKKAFRKQRTRDALSAQGLL